MTRSNKTVTGVIYLSAATALSFLMISRNQDVGTKPAAVMTWLVFCAVPLLFAFTYPVYFFSGSDSEKRRKYAGLTHGLGLLTTTTLFPALALPFWKNPIRDNDSVVLAIGPLAILCVFIVAALFLLIRNKSSLAVVASVLFWPYWLWFALADVDRYFQYSRLQAVFYFLCVITPVFLVFAAGALKYRPALSHAIALFSTLAVPWLYVNVMRDSGLGNVWLIFNVPDSDRHNYSLYPELAILTVGLITVTLATSILRLLPSKWRFRKAPLNARTWPAAATCLVVLALWFSQSVLPYRIPGAVDYYSRPMLQILHIQKHGLQFHESCVSVSGRAGQPRSVTFSGNDRRLFEYQFQEKREFGTLPDPLVQQVSAIIQSRAHARTKSDIVRPVRAWDADAWYFYVEGSGRKAYTSVEGSAPPQEIVNIFHNLEAVPRSRDTRPEKRRDVCLGFCYDPLSEMGLLYANHRCFNDEHDSVCR